MSDKNLRFSAVWDERWARFSSGLLREGVVASKHIFYEAWIRKFLGILKPKRIEQAEGTDVEDFLERLVGEGKEGWRVEQANGALELFCREVVPLDWAPIFAPSKHCRDTQMKGQAQRRTAGTAEVRTAWAGT